MNKSMSGHQRPYRGMSDVWLTPPEIIKELGPFDLDPCSLEPRPWDTAARHIAPPEDGLSKNWFGRVWVNPPYGPETGKWLEKLASSAYLGYCWGFALIFARTETKDFQKHVWGKADAVLFLAGRLHFHHPDGTRAKANSGAPSCIVAYGLWAYEILRTCSLKGRFVDLRQKAQPPTEEEVRKRYG